RNIDISHLQELSAWMQQSAINFLETSERSIILFTLQSQRKFWLSFPAIMSALTTSRSCVNGSESMVSAVQNILSLYSLLTAALVKFDHGTLQRALASDAEQEDELTLFSIECLHIWYALLNPREREAPANGQIDGLPLWTRSEMSRILLPPFVAAQGNSTQWISAFACDLAIFATTPKFRLRDFTLVTCVLIDCVAADHERSDVTLAESPQLHAGLQQTRETWLALSSAFSAIIEKTISILSCEAATRLFYALDNMLSFICQSDSQADRNQPDGVDHLLETYRLKHPEATPDVLQKAAPWEWKLRILAKLIQSGLMQLRVMAVNILCSCLAEVWSQEEDKIDGRPFLCHLGHIVDKELMEYIIGPSCHPEIIAGSANAVVFLIISKASNELILDRLWGSMGSSQDPRVADAITRVTMNALSVLCYEQLVHLCEKFNDVELKDFSPSLRSLWETLIGEMVNKAQLESQPLTVHPFLSVLRVMREIPTSDDGAEYVYPELHTAAMQRARDLLNYELEADVRKKLYRDCASHLASDSHTTLGSLWFISICIRPAIANELQFLTETHNIVQLVVEELESAVSAASEPSVLVLAGHANNARRDLISQIIHFQPKSITEQLGTRLWEVLVGSKALNAADRIAAWQTISTVGNNSGFQNPFLQICFSRHLPHLSASWYCDGMLNFVKENIMLRVNHSDDFNLDDDELVAKSGIEHLWRIILSAHDESIAKAAIVLLASGVYLDSKAISACTVHKAQNSHLKLVRQCLKLMREARHAVQAVPTENDTDDDSVVVVEPERETLQKKRELLRTLRLLQYFLDAYRGNARFAAADLRSLIPRCASAMKGEPTTLHFQAFGDNDNSAIKSLRIGQENSLASLLAALRDETGFQSYKAYYRGRPLIPTQIEAGQSLQALGMCDGLILLTKAAAASEMPNYVKPGSSPVDIEILSHFSEFWQYLIMEEAIAAEAYHFLLRLPADGQLMQRLSADDTEYEDHFVPDQPYRLLYTIFALMECVMEAPSDRTLLEQDSQTVTEAKSYIAMLDKALRLLSRGLDDEMITRTASDRVKVQVTSTLIVQFLRLFDDTVALRDNASAQDIPTPSPRRILSIFDYATSSQEEELVHLSAKCLSLVLRIGSVDEKFWQALAGDPMLAELMRRMSILSDQKQFRHFCACMIEEAIKKEAEMPEKHGRIAKYFWNWALETLSTIPDLGENCDELMKLMCCLVAKMRQNYSESIDLGSLVRQLADYLIAHTCTENINQFVPRDVVAEGLIILLHSCILSDPSLAQSISSAAISTLMKKHLFPQEQNGTNQSLPKIILNPDMRGKLYECIFLNLRAHPNRLLETVQFLEEMVPFFADGSEPYIYELPFQFEQEKAIRSPAGYVGLQNLSNTCYLNSLLTQLYMNPKFRRYLLSFDVDENDDSKALLLQTQRLFTHLQESINRAVEPALFVGAIKTYDQGPIDIHSQMDVDEFYNLLFDRWEAQLPNGMARRKFRSIYGGQLVQQIKSKECGHISERLEPFSAIQCDIKGKSTLDASLQAYVGGEIMDGDNKYKCSSCDRHVDAVKRACLKDIPDNVIFHLKRFDFNLQTLQRSKIDDYFAFPHQLDLQPYTIEHLSGSAPDGKQDMFELVGVLVHTGTAESGHYYSYVRERPLNQDTTPKWVEFNDDNVGVWNPASMEAATFGGPERRSIYEENSITFNKSYSAYMLFYQRISSPGEATETVAVSEPGGCSYTTTGEALKEHIRSENILLLRRRCLFDPNHAKFVQACVYEMLRPGSELEVQLSDLAKPSKACQLAVETALSYLDQIFSRAKNSSYGVHFCNMLAELVKQPGCAWHVLSYFIERPAVLRSLLMRNPDRNIRNAAGQLFVICLEQLSKSCPRLYYGRPKTATLTSDDDDADMADDGLETESALSQAVRLLDSLWKYFQHHIRAWDEYFTTVCQVAQLGREECAAILACGYLERCMTIVSANRAMELEPNFVKMLQNLYRKFSGQPASYMAVLAVINYLMSQLEPELGVETIVDEADERMAHSGEYFAWTSAEVTRLLHPQDEEDMSMFMARLVEINQAPAITKQILERIMVAGEIPTRKLLKLLGQLIRGDATTDPLDSYIRAASIVVDSCSDVSDAQRLLEHICKQAACFQGGEGEAFLVLIRRALDNKRRSEAEREHIRLATLHTIPKWVPHLLQYPDTQVRNGTEQVVDMALNAAGDAGPTTVEARELSSELGLAIGMRCLEFVQEAYVRRRASIDRQLAGALVRILSNCSVTVSESESLAEEDKENFGAQQRGGYTVVGLCDGKLTDDAEILESMTALVVDRAEEEGSEWGGSALSSEAMDEDADTDAAIAMLGSNGFL
ncbi:hypothetical protein LLEC1_00963, partial [Akanthomyces lecanii]